MHDFMLYKSVSNLCNFVTFHDAPTLFCVAIDWILEHMSVRPGINIGNFNITDLVYADDTALLLPSWVMQHLAYPALVQPLLHSA